MTDQVTQPISTTQPTVPAAASDQAATKSTDKPIKSRYQVSIMRDKCISAASCVALAPNTLKLDNENIAIVIDQDGNTDQEKLLSAQSCPTAAVVITDIESGEQIWPLQ